MRHATRATVLLSLFAALTAVIAACDQDSAPSHGLTGHPSEEELSTMSLQLTSTAFRDGNPIPARHTCTDADISPHLEWFDAPDATASFALIMDDPDAPGRTWVHWVVFNLPGSTEMLSENITTDDDLPGDAVHGQNSWRRSNYGGPCPPSGRHRYYFKLYALDTMLNLKPGAPKEALLAAMDGHILAQAQLMGTYQK